MIARDLYAENVVKLSGLLDLCPVWVLWPQTSSQTLVGHVGLEQRRESGQVDEIIV